MPRRPLLDGKPDKLSTEPAQTVCEIPLADIEIGERHRREMGNIAELAQNIAEIGLLHPIVVTPPAQGGRQQLIAGARRFHAYHMLGWDRIPATVLDLDQIARGEYAENFFRKAFTPSEFADIAELAGADRTPCGQAAAEGSRSHESSWEIPRSSWRSP